MRKQEVEKVDQELPLLVWVGDGSSKLSSLVSEGVWGAGIVRRERSIKCGCVWMLKPINTWVLVLPGRRRGTQAELLRLRSHRRLRR